MGRPKGTSKTQISLRLPEDLVDRVKERLLDPVRQKTKYGNLSDLVTGLLYEWDRSNDVKLEDL